MHAIYSLAPLIFLVSLPTYHLAPPQSESTEVVVPLGEVPAELSPSAAKKLKAPDRLPLHVRWSRDGSLAAYIGFQGDEGAERVPAIQRAGEEPLVGEVYDFIDSPTVAADAPHAAFRVGNTRSKTEERWWVRYSPQEVIWRPAEEGIKDLILTGLGEQEFGLSAHGVVAEPVRS